MGVIDQLEDLIISIAHNAIWLSACNIEYSTNFFILVNPQDMKILKNEMIRGSDKIIHWPHQGLIKFYGLDVQESMIAKPGEPKICKII